MGRNVEKGGMVTDGSGIVTGHVQGGASMQLRNTINNLPYSFINQLQSKLTRSHQFLYLSNFLDII